MLLTVHLQPNVERSPTSLRRQQHRKLRGFGSMLSPVNYRRRTPRLVSYYALFKWWLLLSQHPSCHRRPTSLPT